MNNIEFPVLRSDTKCENLIQFLQSFLKFQ
jgi:hypothetical protein